MKTILVVEDEEDLRDTIVWDLERKGFKVRCASNGADALKALSSGGVDLVLSDIRMPGMDGLQLLDRIRIIAPDSPPVILLTGFADVTEAQIISRGATRLLPKPYERAEFFKAVYQAVGIEFK